MADKTLAAIDIGTNSFHLVIAKVNENGIQNILVKEKEVVRLGKSSTDMKYIGKDSMERAIQTLKRFNLLCNSFGSPIRAVATSATREAINKDEFIKRVFEETGIRIEVVSGLEEARLIYLGIIQALPVFDEKILMIDIGGGSTEILVGEKGNVLYSNSIKLGAVRLTEKFFRDERIRDENIKDARIFTRGMLNHTAKEISAYDYNTVIGTSGTLVNLGMIIQAEKNGINSQEFIFNGFKYTDEEVYKTVKKIIKAGNINSVKKIQGLDAARADIITAGAVIAEQIFSELKIKKITLSSYALREGILLDTIDKEHNTILNEDLRNIRYKSVINLAKRHNYDENHTNIILNISHKIFDSVKEKFRLTDKDAEYLEASCYLHDIGHSIAHSQHHRHSYYLIRNSEMLGYNDEEIEIIANISRYHRKSHPKPKHEWFMKLNDANKKKVILLAGILRIADGLDRGHKSSVSDIKIFISGNTFNIIILSSNEDVTLEIWGANMRKGLFEKATGYEVIIKTDNQL